MIEQLEHTGLAATVFDHEWRMRWVSEEQKLLLNEWDEEALGYGRRLPETLAAPVWRRALVPEDVMRWAADMLSWVIADAEGGVQEVIDSLSPDLSEDERAAIAGALPNLEPGGPQPLWVSSVRYVQGDLPTGRDRLRRHSPARSRAAGCWAPRCSTRPTCPPRS